MKYLSQREEIVKYGRLMSQGSLVMGTWGNISLRIDDAGYFAITPSGVGYDVMKAEDIVIVDINGNKIDGDLKPSIEINLHLEIYKGRDDVNGIIHTHSTYVTAHAISRTSIPGAAEDLVQIVGGDVRVSEYFLPGTKELALSALSGLEGRNAVIMANHGLVAASKSLAESFKIANIVEKAAQANVYAKILGGVVELSTEDINIMRDFYLNSYGQR
jgi:L-fuculose-phosphate aldolase